MWKSTRIAKGSCAPSRVASDDVDAVREAIVAEVVRCRTEGILLLCRSSQLGLLGARALRLLRRVAAHDGQTLFARRLNMIVPRLYSTRFLLVGLVCSVAAARALAGPFEPSKARIGRSDLVTGYQACTAPNTTLQMSSLPLPACGPAIPNDTICRFGPNGFGTFKANTASGPDLKLSASLSGLEGCEGAVLCPVASVRMTTDDCADGDPNGCTAVDVTNLQIGIPESVLGCCIVSGGRCSLAGRLSSVLPGILASGKISGLEVVGAGVNRVTGPPHTNPTFTLGFLAK